MGTLQRTLGLGAFASIGGLTWACLQPTQVTLAVTSNVPCEDAAGDEFNDLAIYAERKLDTAKLEFPVAASSACDASSAGSELGTLVLIPGTDDLAVEIAVVAGIARNGSVDSSAVLSMTAEECAGKVGDREEFSKYPCILARRRLDFIESTPLTLTIELSSDCIGRYCDEGSTCFRGACVDAEVLCDGEGCTDPGTTSSTSTGPSSSTQGGGGEAMAQSSASTGQGGGGNGSVGVTMPTVGVGGLGGAGLGGTGLGGTGLGGSGLVGVGVGGDGGAGVGGALGMGGTGLTMTVTTGSMSAVSSAMSSSGISSSSGSSSGSSGSSTGTLNPSTGVSMNVCGPVFLSACASQPCSQLCASKMCSMGSCTGMNECTCSN
jgi:hypothetical protein